ncbi:MAG: glycosyltransferase family 4 protein [Saprospiraceae bacterium]|nr:glycosyltransferase family 4 protein [Saprospiraceae bacterium]
MKIVFLGDSISTQKTGIHYYGLELIKSVLSRYPEHDYRVITTKKIDALSIPQTIVPIVKLLPLHLRMRQLWKIPKIVNQLKPDLVIEMAHFGPFNLSEKIKRVTVIHDLTPIKFPHLHPWQSSLAHKFFLRSIIKKADYLIVNSECTRSDIVKLYAKSIYDIHIFHPPLPSFPVNHAEKKEVDTLTGPYFLTVGTLEPRKNHPTILKAFEKFCEKNRNFKLLIVGGRGWRNRDFEKLLEKSPVKDMVVLSGYVSRAELARHYKGATAFIFASIYEGFGIPILEAQSFGTPLILSENKSFPPMAMGAALRFDTFDADQLSDHMLHVAEDPELRTRLQKQSRASFQQASTLDSNLDQIFRPDAMQKD